jgi:hypothetical protein
MASLFVMSGVSLVLASTSLSLPALVTHEEFIPQTQGGAKIIPTLALHAAALSTSPEQAETSRTLIVGMLLLLAALFLYTLHIVRLHQEAMNTFHARLVHWFKHWLDRDIRTHYRRNFSEE